MSLGARREYVDRMRKRYRAAQSHDHQSAIITEVESVTGYHRVIQLLNSQETVRSAPRERARPKLYSQALDAIKLVWEALDYPCAERLQPALAETARLPESHGELHLDPLILGDPKAISISTLGRRLVEWSHLNPKRTYRFSRSGPKAAILSEIPVRSFDWDESRLGAIEVDLVDHGGGVSQGHYAFTISAVDVITGYSRRRAVVERADRHTS